MAAGKGRILEGSSTRIHSTDCMSGEDDDADSLADRAQPWQGSSKQGFVVWKSTANK